MDKTANYISRCFELAKLGSSLAYPNPIVGSVIVVNDEIIGEGFHKIYGGAHAEPNAINAVKSKYPDTYEYLLSQSDIYVSLEPCSHYGKTPPCTDLILKYKFQKLIFATYDPNPKLDNTKTVFKTIEKNGTKIIYPEMLSERIQKEAIFINRHFFQSLKKKSYFTLKVASNPDGSMLSKEARWITNDESRKEVHRIRACHDLIITGINSIKKDNSRLNIRFPALEIGLDSYRPPNILILKSEQDFTDKERESLSVFQTKVERQVSELKLVDNLEASIKIFLENKPQRVMIEAGPKLVDSFCKSNLLNEIIHYEPLINNHEMTKDAQVQSILKRYQENINLNLKPISTRLLSSKTTDQIDIALTIAVNT